MRTVIFALDDDQHTALRFDARCKGLSVAQYCKMAAFAYFNKYATKGRMAELIAVLEKRERATPGSTDIGSGGNVPESTE